MPIGYVTIYISINKKEIFKYIWGNSVPTCFYSVTIVFNDNILKHSLICFFMNYAVTQ